MKTSKAVELFEEEKIQSMQVVNGDILAAFIYLCSEDYIGKDRNNTPTTLRQEIKELGRMTTSINVNESISYYHSRKAYNAVERDIDFEQRLRKNSYRAAGKKLLFLNAVCKKNMYGGEGFICKRMDTNSDSDMELLVDAFEWTMRQYMNME